MKLFLASWNVLADKLCRDEFVCSFSFSFSFPERLKDIVYIINEMLLSNVIALQECDMLEYLKEKLSPWNLTYIEIGSKKDMVLILNNVTYLNTFNGGFLCLYEDVKFTLYVGHLKSGESQEKEIKRIQQLSSLFLQAKEAVNPIFLLDGNNSDLYEEKYNENRLSKTIEENGYKDALSLQRGNECFKLRHNKGQQVEKHFLLIFDVIDKIIVKNDVTIIDPEHVNDFSFHKYDMSFYDYIKDIRRNKREEFKQMCIDRNISHPSSLEPVFLSLYPHSLAPSDHPPVSCTIEI
jgi:hypothetical protein